MRTMRRHRAFSLVEVLIAVAIIALLAAAVIPSVAGQLRHGQASAISDEINNLSDAIVAYRTNVLKYPLTLDELSTQPTTASKDLCGNFMVNANINQWRGPYVTRVISGDFPVGDATVNNLLTHTGGAGNGTLQINIDFVDTVAMVDLEKQFDPTFDVNAGSIKWNRTGANVGILTYVMPTRGC